MQTKTNKERVIGMSVETGRMLLKLFYACYRLGVSHAATAHDEWLCRAHVDKTRQPGVFGTIVDEYASNDLFWQIKLWELAADNRFATQFDRFRRNAGKLFRNYYSVAYEVAQDFYNAGLTDYCDSPSGCDLVNFLNSDIHQRVKWTKSGIKQQRASRWVSEAQNYALQRQYLSSLSEAKLKAKDHHYIAFIRGIKNACIVNFDAMT